MSMVQEGRWRACISASIPSDLFLRLDARGGTVRERLADVDTLRVTFFQPAGFELLDFAPQLAAADRAAVSSRRAGDRLGRAGRGRP